MPANSGPGSSCTPPIPHLSRRDLELEGTVFSSPPSSSSSSFLFLLKEGLLLVGNVFVHPVFFSGQPYMCPAWSQDWGFRGSSMAPVGMVRLDKT